MSWFSAIPIVGKLIEKSLNIVDEVVEDKDKAREIKATLEEGWRQTDLTKFTEQIKAQSSVIVAEAKGDSWLQRNWRPMLMTLFGFIVFNNYVLYPYLSLFWEQAPVLEIPGPLWGLLKIGVGGYVVGRSSEKIVDKVKEWKMNKR